MLPCLGNRHSRQAHKRPAGPTWTTHKACSLGYPTRHLPTQATRQGLQLQPALARCSRQALAGSSRLVGNRNHKPFSALSRQPAGPTWTSGKTGLQLQPQATIEALQPQFSALGYPSRGVNPAGSQPLVGNKALSRQAIRIAATRSRKGLQRQFSALPGSHKRPYRP